MQKLVYLLFIFFISINGITAQRHHPEKREKLKAYKTAYITEQLDLSAKEAEKFWPVYNSYEKKFFKLKVNRMSEVKKLIDEKGGIDALTEKEADALLVKISQNEQAVVDAQKDLYKNLKEIIPAKKILLLNKAEHDFNRKLLSDYRKRRYENN